MRGDEKRVVDAFCAYLKSDGWSVQREVAFCDVVARRPGETMYCEAKGRTTEVGLDVDTLYGQLLRRMKDVAEPGDLYAVVVPSEAEVAALRVPARVRESLGIRVFVVTADNEIEAR